MIFLPGVLSNLPSFVLYALIMSVIAALAIYYQTRRKPHCQYCGSHHEIVRGLKTPTTICLKCFTDRAQLNFGWKGEKV